MEHELLKRVRELNLPKDKYAIFGSGPICIRGLREFSHDLDVIVINEVFDAMRNDERFVLRKLENTSEYLEWNGIELYKDWQPGEWDIGDLIRDAEVIEGLPFVEIEDVLKWKRISGRDKDIRDIKLIEDYLNYLKYQPM